MSDSNQNGAARRAPAGRHQHSSEPRDERRESRGPANPDEGNGEKKPGAPHRAKNSPPWYRRPFLAAGVFLALLVITIGGILWWSHSRRYESTDDASIDVLSQVASPQLGGRVARVPVAENQEVTEGTVLVELDPADYRAREEQARALGAQALAQGEQAQAQRAIFEAQREQARASLTVAATSADNAARDFARLEGLRQDNTGAVSQQQWDKAEAAQKSTAAQVQAAEKAIAAAEAQVNSSESLLSAARAAQASAAAQLQQAELNLSYTEIRAKMNGRVANLRVAPGNFVQPGSALMAVVPGDVYVTANFKETQLGLMRRGQPVKISVDAYPDMDFPGHVDSVQPATGQIFSSLPAENATGNWVKVVQRVPVKITFDRLPDDPDRRLGPGMSVEVKVTVR